jgi:hypothetical protein
LQPRQARLRLLFTCVASPRTLSLATIPVCPVKGRRSASSYPAPAAQPCDRAVRREKDASLRLLQPTSPNEHPRDCSIPSCVFTRVRLAPHACETPAHPGPMASRFRGLGTPIPLTGQANRVELRLTASLQLQPPPQRRSWDLSHDPPAQRSPGGASIESSSAPSFPIRAFSAADRACDVASDVLCDDPV